MALRTVTFHHLFQVLPQDVSHEVRCQVQESVLSQVTQCPSCDVKLLEVDVGQTELTGCPAQPLVNLLLAPASWV